MAGKLRYWKEKDGRFWARIAVPERLRPFIEGGKSELIEPLGGDRRAALRLHPAAVARLQDQIALAAQRAEGKAPLPDPLTTADFGRAVWQRYAAALDADAANRERYPGNAEIEAAREKLVKEANAAGVDLSDPLEVLDLSLDFLRIKHARDIDSHVREARLSALQGDLAAGETRQVEHEIDAYLEQRGLSADHGTAERSVLAKHLMRAEIEALQRTLERDRGDYTGQPSDPIVRPPAPENTLKPVSITGLWDSYVESRVVAGFMKDGGKRARPVFENLRKFLGHNNALLVTKKNLLEWRDHLLHVDKLSAKTTSDIYLSAVRSLFLWAHENERLPENVAATVKQPKPRRQRAREAGFTDAEALAILAASRSHVPKPNQFGFIRETSHMTAAKRWTPILCAFSGARISEVTQLRREDIRQEGDRWVMRVTPEAGTVKAGDYRDVPLHSQIIALGFIEFVEAAGPGPMFHGADDPSKFATAARSVSDEVAKWLRRANLAPEGIQPNHAWRHRLKTLARDLGADMRVVDAIQGHASRSASDDYGDVSLVAKTRVIDLLPDYELT